MIQIKSKLYDSKINYKLKIITNRNYEYETLVSIEHPFHMSKIRLFNQINNLRLS